MCSFARLANCIVTTGQNSPPETKTYFILAATDQEVVVTRAKNVAKEVERGVRKKSLISPIEEPVTCVILSHLGQVILSLLLPLKLVFNVQEKAIVSPRPIAAPKKRRYSQNDSLRCREDRDGRLSDRVMN